VLFRLHAVVSLVYVCQVTRHGTAAGRRRCSQCSRFLKIFLEEIFLVIFLGQVWENLGKTPSHPQQFVCYYTYAHGRPEGGGAKRTITPLECGTKNQKFLESLISATLFRLIDLILGMTLYLPV